jgi:hypothetical protein
LGRTVKLTIWTGELGLGWNGNIFLFLLATDIVRFFAHQARAYPNFPSIK